MKYIESLREGERINEIYLCKVKQSALTKAGKPYDTLILQDKTGTLDAKIWEPGSVGIDEFDSLDYIAVMGDITREWKSSPRMLSGQFTAECKACSQGAGRGV